VISLELVEWRSDGLRVETEAVRRKESARRQVSSCVLPLPFFPTSLLFEAQVENKDSQDDPGNLSEHVLVLGHSKSRRIEMLVERMESMLVVLDVVDIVIYTKIAQMNESAYFKHFPNINLPRSPPCLARMRGRKSFDATSE